MTISDLEDRRAILLLKTLELDQARDRALVMGRMEPKLGGTTLDETNARAAKIAIEQRAISTELVELEISIAEMVAVQPIVLKGSDLADIIGLFEYAFNARTPSGAVLAALDRLRRLAHLQPKVN
jgi:hypothetical protein